MHKFVLHGYFNGYICDRSHDMDVARDLVVVDVAALCFLCMSYANADTNEDSLLNKQLTTGKYLLHSSLHIQVEIVKQ